MKVLVTGGAGFIGSHAVDYLTKMGHSVTVLDNLSSGSKENLRQRVPFLRLDIRDRLVDAFRKVSPHVVVHLAAQVSVPKSITSPGLDQATNIGGLVNVMEAAGASGVQKIVSFSSAAVYGIPESMPITEGSVLQALSPYGLSKLSGEAYVRMLADLYGMTYTIIRPANVYGPGQTTEGEGAVVPAFLDRFLRDTDPVIHGTGLQTRDFVYVCDVARAIGCALTKANGATVNVSSGIGTPIIDLWKALAQLAGWSRPPIYGDARPGDIPHSVMDNRLAMESLEWSPTVDLRQGLNETIQWHVAKTAAIAHQR